MYILPPPTVAQAAACPIGTIIYPLTPQIAISREDDDDDESPITTISFYGFSGYSKVTANGNVQWSAHQYAINMQAQTITEQTLRRSLPMGRTSTEPMLSSYNYAS